MRVPVCVHNIASVLYGLVLCFRVWGLGLEEYLCVHTIASVYDQFACQHSAHEQAPTAQSGVQVFRGS